PPARCGWPYADLEAPQRRLAQCSRIDIGRDPHPVRCLVIGREMLHRGAHTRRLDSPYQAGAEKPGEHRILGEVLEIAAAQGGAFDVHTRPENDSAAMRGRCSDNGLTPTGHNPKIAGSLHAHSTWHARLRRH